MLDIGFSPSMWQRLKNFAASLQSYSQLSPDIQARQRVRRLLNQRPCLSSEEWFQRFWQPLEVSRPVVDFVYRYFSQYSGLDFSRVYPSDRLVEDLKFPLVCWFDWENTLIDDFLQNFSVDLSDCFDVLAYQTLEDLVLKLHARLMQEKFSAHS